MPEGTVNDDSDQDGGLTDEQSDDDDLAITQADLEKSPNSPTCEPPADVMRSKTEDLGDSYTK